MPEEQENQNPDEAEENPSDNAEELEDLRVQLADSKKELADLRKRKSPRRRKTTTAAKPRAASARDEEDDSDDVAREATERYEEAKRENEELTGKLRKVRAQTIAASLRVVDPEAVVALLDWEDLEDPDDDAEIKGAMKDLLKRKPYLVKGVGLDAGARGSRPQKETMNDLFRRRARAQRR